MLNRSWNWSQINLLRELNPHFFEFSNWNCWTFYVDICKFIPLLILHTLELCHRVWLWAEMWKMKVNFVIDPITWETEAQFQVHGHLGCLMKPCLWKKQKIAIELYENESEQRFLVVAIKVEFIHFEAGLEFVIILLQPLECWDHRHVPSWAWPTFCFWDWILLYCPSWSQTPELKWSFRI
jgi:hypothetical protein